jgi:hypothetical protein
LDCMVYLKSKVVPNLTGLTVILISLHVSIDNFNPN